MRLPTNGHDKIVFPQSRRTVRHPRNEAKIIDLKPILMTIIFWIW